MIGEQNIDYTIKPVHVSTIKSGDTVEIDGVLKTVSKKDIKTGGMMGTTLFGDSFKAGTTKVKKAIIKRALPGAQKNKTKGG